jgi:hypothetical protein
MLQCGECVDQLCSTGRRCPLEWEKVPHLQKVRAEYVLRHAQLSQIGFIISVLAWSYVWGLSHSRIKRLEERYYPSAPSRKGGCSLCRGDWLRIGCKLFVESGRVRVCAYCSVIARARRCPPGFWSTLCLHQQSKSNGTYNLQKDKMICQIRYH